MGHRLKIIGLILHKLYTTRKYKGETLNITKPFAESTDVSFYIKQLLDDGVLSQQQLHYNDVYSLLGARIDKIDPDELACTIDPFAYVSHLSAMDYHGLTDRNPSTLFITTPAPKDWASFAEKRMQSDLKEDYQTYIENGLPKLTRPKFDKIGKTDVHTFASKHPGAYKTVKDRALRVSTIGRTFLEMLRQPELCGGINHVLDVYQEHAPKYLKLITNEIDGSDKKLDKVRAGYILDERLHIKNDTVEQWASLAQRGGSQKLDASSEYLSKWSEKWCISLNVF